MTKVITPKKRYYKAVHIGFSKNEVSFRYYKKLGFKKYDTPPKAMNHFRVDQKLNISILEEVVKEITKEQLEDFAKLKVYIEENFEKKFRKKVKTKVERYTQLHPAINFYITQQSSFNPTSFYRILKKGGINTDKIDKKMHEIFGTHVSGSQFMFYGRKHLNDLLLEKLDLAFVAVVNKAYKSVIKK